MDIDKIKAIQGILGVAQDGIWGPKSQAALNAVIAPSTRHVVKATSFADPKDVAQYEKWYTIYLADGLSEKEAANKAMGKGDNAIGYWGDPTGEGSGPSCALPPDDIIEKWGTEAAGHNKMVKVTIGNNQATIPVKDVMPWKRHITNGAGIDLNPDACKLLGVSPPLFTNAEWEWA